MLKEGKLADFQFLHKEKVQNRFHFKDPALKDFVCQIASDLNLKQKEFEKFELLKSTSKSTLIHVRQAVSGAFRW